MVVVYLYGKDVFAQVSIQYVIKQFSQLDEAIRLLSKRTNLSFEKSIDRFGYKVYDCTDATKKIRIIAEEIPLIK